MFKSQDFNPDSFAVKTDEKRFLLEQDVSAYKEHAKEQRDIDATIQSNRQYRSFAIIPDIVAIDILTKYGIDIHAPEFMHDKTAVRRVKNIIMSEYPALLTSNIKKV
jgi:hypothetical protein